MPDTRLKPQAKKLWITLLRSFTPNSQASQSSSSQAASLPIRRNVTFRESVGRFQYSEIDSTSSFGDPALTWDERLHLSQDPKVPADAIVFGNLDFVPLPRSLNRSNSCKNKEAPQASALKRSTSRRAVPHARPLDRSNSTRATPADGQNALAIEKRKEKSKEPGPKPLRDLNDLQRRTTRLLQSFVLTDARLGSSPVFAMSNDLLPRIPLRDKEVLYFEDDFGVQTSGIFPFEKNSRRQRMLLMKRPMVSMTSERPSFELFGQVNITKLTKDGGMEDPDEDVWLTTAARELKKLLARDGAAARRIPKIPDSWEKYLVLGLEALLAFHELFFTLEHPRPDSTNVEITNVSTRFLEKEKPFIQELERRMRGPNFKIRELLAKKEKFFFDAQRGPEETQQLICCAPLFGPDLACWICFLVSGPIFERSAGFI